MSSYRINSHPSNLEKDNSMIKGALRRLFSFVQSVQMFYHVDMSATQEQLLEEIRRVEKELESSSSPELVKKRHALLEKLSVVNASLNEGSVLKG